MSIVNRLKFLIIQTAFIGDVVIATAIVEKLKQFYPDSTFDFLLRKGNESLLDNNPHLHQVLIFDKKKNKYRNLLRMIKKIRAEKYDYAINAQRFLTTGILTVLSGARHTIGYDKNPLSSFFTEKIVHVISSTEGGQNETERNLALIERLTDRSFVKPKLYPSLSDFEKVKSNEEYICIAPATVWHTKQLPTAKWIELIQRLPDKYTIYLIASKEDIKLCEEIKSIIHNPKFKIKNLAGQLTFLQSAALMKNARMNFVNDSAPLHFASAMNAPVTAIYCSTIPAFGFGPLSDISYVAEIDYPLYCRPCGIHGRKKCPEGHFKCSEVEVDQVVKRIFN